MPVEALSWKRVWAGRLARHRLLGRASAGELVETVRAVCGIHAQVMPASELSLGIRVDGITREDVRSALTEKRLLVKTFGLRGTLHLFPADELPLWMAALRARSSLDPRKQQLTGLDPAQLQAIVEAIGTALGGQPLTLNQLGDRVVEQVGAWAGEPAALGWRSTLPRWRAALGDAALAGLLCYGPPQGSQVTFVSPREWVGERAKGWREIEPGEALAEVFLRYVRTYGPATTRDFAQWFNIPPRAAREMAAPLLGELQEVDVEGYRAYMLREDAVGSEGDSAGRESALREAEQGSVRLLPLFDCYVIGCHPRERLLPPEWAEHVPKGTIPSQLPLLLVDGTVAGVWERVDGPKRRGEQRRVELRVQPFAPLSKHRQSQLADEAARIGTILGVDAVPVIGEVSIRPHL